MCPEDSCLPVRMLYGNTPKGQITKQLFGDEALKMCQQFQMPLMDMDGNWMEIYKFSLNG